MTERNPVIDGMIELGLSVHKMGIAAGICESTVRNYLKKTNQYEIWKNSKKTVPNSTINVNRINQVIREGARSLDEISLEAKVSRREIRKLKDEIIWTRFKRNSLDYFLQNKDLDMAEAIGFSHQTIYRRAKALEVSLPRSVMVNRKNVKRKQVIDEMLEQGSTLKEMASAAGLKSHTGVQHYLRATGQYEAWKGFRKERKPKRKPVIDEMLEQGPTLREMADAAGFNSQGVVYYYLKKTDQYEAWKGYRAKRKRKTVIDNMLEDGPTLQEMADAAEYNSQRSVYHYLKETDQHDAWKGYRNSKRQAPKSLLSVIAGQIQQHTYSRAETWPERKAVEYVKNFKNPNTVRRSLQDLTELFSRYEQARIKGETPSLEELGEGLYRQQQVSDIFGKVNLKPLKQIRNNLSREQIEAIDKAYYSDLPIPDIVYFIGVEYHVVRGRFQKIGKRERKKPVFYEMPYRLADQIFEAIDLGFTIGEIGELYETITPYVKKALDDRSQIENKIRIELEKIGMEYK